MTPNRIHAAQTPRFNPVNSGAPAATGEINPPNGAGAGYELRFRSLFDEGRGYAFPCDAAGHVDLDGLGERARNSYFYARTLIGRDFSMPVIQPSPLH